MGFYQTGVRINISIDNWFIDDAYRGRQVLVEEYGYLEHVIIEALWVCGQLHRENQGDIMTVFENINELCGDLFLPMYMDEWGLSDDDALESVYAMQCMVKDMYPCLMAYCRHLTELDYDFTLDPDYIEDIMWEVFADSGDTEIGLCGSVTVVCNH